MYKLNKRKYIIQVVFLKVILNCSFTRIILMNAKLPPVWNVDSTEGYLQETQLIHFKLLR